MFFVVVEVILEILIPLLMARIIDLGIEARDINAVYKYGFIMFIIAIGTLSTGFLAGNMPPKHQQGLLPI